MSVATGVALSFATAAGAWAAGYGGHAAGASGHANVGVSSTFGSPGHSGFASGDGRRFAGPSVDWGFRHGRGWRRHQDGDLYDFAPYWGFGDFGDEEGFGGDGGPAFGPQPPMGDSFEAAAYRYRRPPAPIASYLAPSAYGPGPHDGAYAYGYNGHAEVPALPPEAAAGIAAVGVETDRF